MVHKMEKTKEGALIMVPNEMPAAPKADQQGTKFSKGKDGSITVEPVVDSEVVAAPVLGAKPVDAGLGKKAVITTLAKEGPTPTVMDATNEVSWSDLRPVASQLSEDVREKIHGLVGLAKAAAEEVLNELVQLKKIGSFRILTAGQPATMDVDPSRVQVVATKKGLVSSVKIG